MSAPQVFLTETRERFLKAVVGELPAERIRELYLFAPIRQGGVESGIAVIAAELPESAEPVGSESLGSESLGSESLGSESLVGADTAADADPTCAVAPDPGPPTPDPRLEVAPDPGPPTPAPRLEVAPDPGPPTPDPRLEVAPAPPPPTPAPRYTVYTARYRHTQKGPDRGKWESSVVAEADAPLLSIETVVRGVQRRSGDVDPPDHMSGDEVRGALRITPPAHDA